MARALGARAQMALAYEDWRQALDWVRDGLLVGGMLREIEITAAMPKSTPWQGR